MNLLGPIFISALISFYAGLAQADQIAFDKTDFKAAKIAAMNGETVTVLAELSPRGLKKLKSVGKETIGKDLKVTFAGETRSMKIRDEIRGGQVQFGPFSKEFARKILTEINARI